PWKHPSRVRVGAGPPGPPSCTAPGPSCGDAPGSSPAVPRSSPAAPGARRSVTSAPCANRGRGRGTSQPCSASVDSSACQPKPPSTTATRTVAPRSEEHTSELQSRENLVCRLLLEKKKEHQITPATLPNREARADATLPRYVHAGACG